MCTVRHREGGGGRNLKRKSLEMISCILIENQKEAMLEIEY